MTGVRFDVDRAALVTDVLREVADEVASLAAQVATAAAATGCAWQGPARERHDGAAALLARELTATAAVLRDVADDVTSATWAARRLSAARSGDP